MPDYIGSVDEHVRDEHETAQLNQEYMERKSAETDAEYGWDPGTCLALWERQYATWHDFDGGYINDDLVRSGMGGNPWGLPRHVVGER